MRADRLLSLLMLLQSRGRMTARRLAKELEVSERTIYRDIDALSLAGVPVYGQPGPEGGYALVDSYRTDLTGLTKEEVRALLMLSVPMVSSDAPLAELGLGQELNAALLKLAAALPSGTRGDEAWVRQRFHFDPTWWRQGHELVPHLQTIQRAVWQDKRLRITYRTPFSAELERLISPYGLVAKAGVWYLVYDRDGRIRVHRVSELSNVQVCGESFERPVDFDLAAFWAAWCNEHESSFSLFRTTVRVAPNFLPLLPSYFGDSIRAILAQAAPPDTEGWITLELSFESFAAARDRMLGFGRGVEILEPPALRRSVLDIAEQVVALYTG